jgi:hypothetical protein
VSRSEGCYRSASFSRAERRGDENGEFRRTKPPQCAGALALPIVEKHPPDSVAMFHISNFSFVLRPRYNSPLALDHRWRGLHMPYCLGITNSLHLSSKLYIYNMVEPISLVFGY